MQDAAFDFFVTSFERANPKFDYFAFERFAPPQIQDLVRELSTFASELVPGCTRELVFSRYNSIYRRSIWDNVGTEDLRGAVARLTNEMLSFIRGECVDDQSLWVLGM